jgi:hypothetical protein
MREQPLKDKAAPIRAKHLRDSEAPSLPASQTDMPSTRDGAAMRDREEPSLEKLLSDIADPSLMKSRTETFDPKRANDLIEMELPTEM